MKLINNKFFIKRWFIMYALSPVFILLLDNFAVVVYAIIGLLTVSLTVSTYQEHDIHGDLSFLQTIAFVTGGLFISFLAYLVVCLLYYLTAQTNHLSCQLYLAKVILLPPITLIGALVAWPTKKPHV